MSEVKALHGVHVKSEARGEVTAIFSRFHLVDADNDVTLPGAFRLGAEVPISAYQHSSWQGALPVGRGVIRADREAAWVEAAFFLGTASGRDTFATVKALGPLGAWSYGYDVLDFDDEQRDGRRVRVLKRLAVHEVSPVLVGAGIRTMTLSAKDVDLPREYARFVASVRAERQREQDAVVGEYARFVRAQVEGVV